MGTYVLPQVRVFQEFARTPNDVTQSLNAFLIGPSYQLMRYADKSERASCTYADYKTGEALPLQWAAGYTGSKPDTSWYGVTVAGAYVDIGGGSKTGTCKDKSPTGTSAAGYGTKFEFTSSKAIDSADDPAFGVTVRVGDFLVYTDGSEIKATKIRSITSVATASGADIVYKAEVVVTDLVPVVAAGTASLKFARHFDAIDIVEASLTPTASGVTVAAHANADIGASSVCEVIFGRAYLNQRNLRVDHSDGVYSVASDADIFQELGAYDSPDSPLAYGLHIMRLNSVGSVRYIAVESDDSAGYAKALDRASVTTDVYAFCPLTEDKSIIDMIVADCNRLSTPEEKSWRISFFSLPTSKVVDVTPQRSGVPEKCKVDSSKHLTCYNAGGTATSTVAKFTETVRVGDTVKVQTGTTTFVETKVKSIESNTSLTLEDSVSGASSTACTFWILHELGYSEYVDAIAATSENFKDRRAYNVFPNSLRASDGRYVSGMYGAAAVCALACSVQPQQPITNVEIKGFTDLPDVYSKFSRDELNRIAAGGTLILMQDKRGGAVYVRHQISTAYSDGDLNETELSLVKNLDSVSYYFANRFAPYHGRYNVSDDLITELRGIIEDGLAHLETTTETNKLIGPQVLAEGTEIRALYRDPDEKDRVYANVALNLPAPFNNFDLHLQVI